MIKLLEINDRGALSSSVTIAYDLRRVMTIAKGMGAEDSRGERLIWQKGTTSVLLSHLRSAIFDFI